MSQAPNDDLTAFRRPRIRLRAGLLCLSLLLLLLPLLNQGASSWATVQTTEQSSAQSYPIKGFDVSHHQGKIQWSLISPQQYQFVYLKATEGGDFNDRQFQDNWLGAREQGLHVGAYHFFRLCTDGEAQARHFIQTVPNKANALPPVIDLEYDSACINSSSKEQLLKQIRVMHDRLYQHYAKQPIFYTTPNFYHIILKGSFAQTPIWIRDYQSVHPAQAPQWLFWQHSNQGRIKGISTQVDLNVFHGSNAAWEKFLQHHAQAAGSPQQ